MYWVLERSSEEGPAFFAQIKQNWKPACREWGKKTTSWCVFLICSPPASLRTRDKGSLPQSGPLHPPFPILSPQFPSSDILVFLSHNCMLQKSPETPHPPCSAHSAVALLQNPRLSWRLLFYVPSICILEEWSSFPLPASEQCQCYAPSSLLGAPCYLVRPSLFLRIADYQLSFS